MDKKTINVSAKVSERTHRAATEALGRTGTKTMSRFLQSCIDDLIAAHQAGERIVEPVQLARQPRLGKRKTS